MDLLGDRIAEFSGQISSQRVLPSDGSSPIMETTVQDAGTVLGVAAQQIITYTSTVRADGSIAGEGQGVLTTAEGDMAAVTAAGVGTLGQGGAVEWVGSLYYFSSAEKLARLNGVVSVFEYAIDGQGNTKGEFWEWK